jgi:UDP-glucose-4-epimerase GalE
MAIGSARARVLVVGGAGYIGSVCGRALREAGHHTVTFDDLSTGHRAAVEDELVVGDVRDRASLRQVLRHGRFDAVLHFAARSLVGESVEHPLRYFDVNVGGTATLVDSMLAEGVRSLVFSSTCAIYGDPERTPLTEDHPSRPVSPYGESKAMVERMLAACREKEGLRVTTLRYFNAAGATADGQLGEAHEPETHLIPLAIASALGQRGPLQIFGEKYPTPDGTCIRDYVHVQDLAEVHRLAVTRLLEGEVGTAYNVGTGIGTSVRQVIDSVQRVLGRPVPTISAPPREGDPPALFASADKARRELGWEPRWDSIDDITRTACAWAVAPRYGRRSRVP